MKWFKMEGWTGHNDFEKWADGMPPDMGSDWDLAGYTAHLESIKHRLPSSLLEASLALHDAQLLSMHTDVQARSTDLLVLTERGHEHWTLDGVELVRWVNNVVELGGPPGFGHMGYDEIEIDGNGLITLRILFSKGLELHLSFRGFSLDRDPRLP